MELELYLPERFVSPAKYHTRVLHCVVRGMGEIHSLRSRSPSNKHSLQKRKFTLRNTSTSIQRSSSRPVRYFTPLPLHSTLSLGRDSKLKFSCAIANCAFSIMAASHSLPGVTLTEGFPLVITPNAPLTLDWVNEHQSELTRLLSQYGGIMFRGFPIHSPADFGTLVTNFRDWRDLPYNESLSLAVRLPVCDRVCTVSFVPVVGALAVVAILGTRYLRRSTGRGALSGCTAGRDLLTRSFMLRTHSISAACGFALLTKCNKLYTRSASSGRRCQAPSESASTRRSNLASSPRSASEARQAA